MSASGTNIRKTLILSVLLFSLMVSGCGFLPFYTEGQKFRPGRASELVKGSSTRSEVLDLFGDPRERSTADLNKATWWRYHYTYLGNLGVERAELEITFQDNVVADYQVNVQKSRY
jgi:outer membrane protein assembly factor BamE (lipoprotein component of BamABCDE complex)